MSRDNLINSILRSGPGPRNIQLVGQPLAARSGDSTKALVENQLTLIYPGADLERIAGSEENGQWNDLGRIAIGSVARAADSGPAEGRLIYWNGPHARFGLLDPARQTWLELHEADPAILPAGVGAQAQWGLERAIAALAHTSAHPPAHALVLGQGMLGHLAGLWLQREDVSVTVIENSPKRLEFSKYAGLTRRVDTHNRGWIEKVRRLNPDGADLLVDAAGNPKALPELITVLRPGGLMLRLGPWRPAMYPDPVREALDAAGSQVVGPFAHFGDEPGHRGLLGPWIERIRSGEIPTDRILTHHVNADEAPLAMKRLATGIRSWCGTVIHWRSDADTEQ